MLLFSPRWLFLAPGMLLFTVSLIGGALLVRGPVYIGAAAFDTNSLLVLAMMLLLAFQVVVYAVFARMFAVSAGLLKEDAMTARAQRLFTLEGGVTIGTLLTLGGVGLIAYIVFVWRSRGWGALDSQSQRLVIAGVTSVILGVQTIFASFFLSILGLARR
jgi:hypothetical protein